MSLTARLVVHLTPDELARVRDLAAADGRTPSDWVRRTLLGHDVAPGLAPAVRRGTLEAIAAAAERADRQLVPHPGDPEARVLDERVTVRVPLSELPGWSTEP